MKKILLVLAMFFLIIPFVYGEEISPELAEIYKIVPELAPRAQQKIKKQRSSGAKSYEELRCGTIDYKKLFLNFSQLSPRAQKVAQQRIYSRPTDPAVGTDLYFDPQEIINHFDTKNGYGNFRIWYTLTRTSRNNNVESYDSDFSLVPDYVEKCGDIFESVWQKEMVEMGYQTNIKENDIKDIMSDKGVGGGEKYDIYILNVDFARVFGYTISEARSLAERTSSSYIVIDNDYPESVYNETVIDGKVIKIKPYYNRYDVLRYTAAHEFFHAIQNAYDLQEDIWWSEASSVWMEEQVYKDLNGYLIYLKDFFNYPWISINRNAMVKNPAPNHHYAAGIFPIFLTTYFKDTNLMHLIWKKCADEDYIYPIQSMDAIEKVLKTSTYSSSLSNMFNKFTIYNFFTDSTKNYNPYLHGGKYYSDAASYPEIKASNAHTSYPVVNRSPIDAEKPAQWGANYIIFHSEDLDSNLKISFSGNGGQNVAWQLNLIKLNAVKGEAYEEIPITANNKGEIIINKFGSYYKKVVMIPMLIKSDTTYSYTYSAEYVDDSTPPDKVTNLNIVSNGDSNITLTWHNPQKYDTSDFEGVKIIRNIAQSNSYDSFFIENDTTFADVLSNGSNVSYGLYSYDEMRNFSQAETINYTMIDSTAPPIITVLTAEDDESNGKVNLNWTGLTKSDDINGYHIYMSTASFDSTNNLIPLATMNMNDLTYTVSGLTNNMTYYFAISAFDEAGNENKKVQITQAALAKPTLDITPPAPVVFNLGPGDVENSIKLDWLAYNEVKDVTYYRIYKSTYPFASLSANYLADSTIAGTKSYVFSGLANKTIYYFAVIAIDEMYNESTDVTVKSWGFNKIMFSSPIRDEIKIYKNGNYAYKGQYVSNVDSKNSIDLYLFPKKNFLAFMSLNLLNFYTTVDASLGATISNTYFNKYVPVNNLLFNPAVKIASTGVLNAAPFVIDWDCDGKKDILVGDKSGYIHFFKNTGSDSSPKLGQEEFIKYENGDYLKVEGNATPFVIDWNNDEDKDLLVGSIDGKVYYFENTGTDEKPKWNKPVILKDLDGNEINVNENSLPVVMDRDLDDKKEIMVGSRRGEADLYLNMGADYNPLLKKEMNTFIFYINSLKIYTTGLFSVVNLTNKSTNEFLIGDVSGKLYHCEKRSNTPYYVYKLKTTDGKEMDVGENAFPFLIDWDNNNYMDILAGNANGDIYIYYGKPVPPPEPLEASSGGNGPCFISRLFFKSSEFIENLLLIRDRFLLNNPLGKYFAGKYYSIQ
ncbi:hypothetical protein HZA55_05735 [Candidatus Poribacteria bacterium]|nr:hypothetical protein [Candidatus Poribacteria bacterium]